MATRWTRFLVTLGIGLGLAAPLLADHDEGHLMVLPDQLEWKDVASMPPGAKAAVLEGDPSKADSFTMRIEFPPQYTIPVHTHPAVELARRRQAWEPPRRELTGALARYVKCVGPASRGCVTDE